MILYISVVYVILMANTTTLFKKPVSRTRIALALLFAGIVNLFLGVLPTSADSGDHMMGWGGGWNYMYIFIVIWIFVAILVAQDASSRGENGLLWGIITLIMPMMGLFFYLIFLAIRSDRPKSTIAPVPTTYGSAPPVTQPIVKSSPTFEGDKQFCIECGAPNDLKAKFCNKCGAALPTFQGDA